MNFLRLNCNIIRCIIVLSSRVLSVLLSSSLLLPRCYRRRGRGWEIGVSHKSKWFFRPLGATKVPTGPDVNPAFLPYKAGLQGKQHWRVKLTSPSPPLWVGINVSPFTNPNKVGFLMGVSLMACFPRRSNRTYSRISQLPTPCNCGLTPVANSEIIET